MRIAQLTDTHVVEPGGVSHGLDTAAYLSAAIAAVNALRPAVDFTIVTGDLVDGGREAQYDHFAERMAALDTPWSVVPGNHDDASALRGVLPAERSGTVVPEARIGYTVDLGAARVVGLDANAPGIWPGARFGPEAAAWLAATLTADRRPTLLAVHHPPFRSGLWYLDLFGFRGARRLREVVEAQPHVGRVVSGHIHCVRHVRWRLALACTAPSTSPQFLPRVHKLDVEMQEPGFAIHDHDERTGWMTTIYRRAAAGYEPAERFS